MVTARFRADLHREMCILSPDGYDPEDEICSSCLDCFICSCLHYTIQYVQQMTAPTLLPEFLVSPYKGVRDAANAKFEELS